MKPRPPARRYHVMTGDCKKPWRSFQTKAQAMGFLERYVRRLHREWSEGRRGSIYTYEFSITFKNKLIHHRMGYA